MSIGVSPIGSRLFLFGYKRMMDDGKEYQRIVDGKCRYCYKKDWCMLLPSQRAMDCLGPFKDEEDNIRKYREWVEKEAKPKADIEGLVRRSGVTQYWLNRMLFESKSGGGKQNPDEDNE